MANNGWRRQLRVWCGQQFQAWGARLLADASFEDASPAVESAPTPSTDTAQRPPAHWLELLQSSEAPLQWFGRKTPGSSPQPAQPAAAIAPPEPHAAKALTEPPSASKLARPAMPTVRFEPTPPAPTPNPTVGHSARQSTPPAPKRPPVPESAAISRPPLAPSPLTRPSGEGTPTTPPQRANQPTAKPPRKRIPSIFQRRGDESPAVIQPDGQPTPDGPAAATWPPPEYAARRREQSAPPAVAAPAQAGRAPTAEPGYPAPLPPARPAEPVYPATPETPARGLVRQMPGMTTPLEPRPQQSEPDGREETAEPTYPPATPDAKPASAAGQPAPTIAPAAPEIPALRPARQPQIVTVPLEPQPGQSEPDRTGAGMAYPPARATTPAGLKRVGTHQATPVSVWEALEPSADRWPELPEPDSAESDTPSRPDPFWEHSRQEQDGARRRRR